MKDNPLFVAPDGERWFIVQNIDHCDRAGNHGMASKVHGNATGYRTYHDAHAAMHDLKLGD